MKIITQIINFMKELFEKEPEEEKKIRHYIPDLGKRLAKYTAKEMVERVGDEAIKEVVGSVLCGGNIRSLTEGLTRRRITLSNASLLYAYLHATKNIKGFFENISSLVSSELSEEGLLKEEKIYLNWMLGLTGKGIQNVLRSNPKALVGYLKELDETLEEAALQIQKELGPILAQIQFDDSSILLRWSSLLHIFMGIGAQTLALRGSEKSMYGKLFEKLIIGSCLSILGFELIDKDDTDKMDMVFWLSERGDKRESDATLLVRPGIGIRFDIGFIGPGNTEISLDKVSRFESVMEYGKKKHNMQTIVLIDRIGAGSRIQDMAKEINGHIVQMSMSFWVKEVASILADSVGYKHEILKLSNEESIDYINKQIELVNLNDFTNHD